MKYCPNPSCRYAVRHGRPAEFVDRAVCTECGTLLGSVAPVLQAAATPVAADSDAGRRLAVTAGAAALVGLGLRLPLFGLEGSIVGGEPELATRLLPFGVTPFLSGYVLVVLVARLVPGLRERRVGGARARAPLERAALVVGGLLLALQILSFVRFTGSAQTRVLFPSPGLLWAQYLAAHFGLLLLVRFVSRRGLGNGFAMVALVGAANLAAEVGSRLWVGLRSEALAPGALLELLVAVGAASWLAVRLSRATRPGDGAGPTCAPFPISGVAPWAIAQTLVVLPMTLTSFLPPLTEVARWLQSSPLAYYGVTVFVNLDATVLLGLLFFSPRAVGRLWARWVKGVDETGVVARARALLPRAMVLAAVAIGALPLASAFLGASLAGSTGFLLGELAVGALIGLDLVDEWRARRQLGLLVAVYQVNRMAEVEPIAFVLRTHGIPCHLRTFAWRATLQFFGPYAPVEVLVPTAHAGAAAALLEGSAAPAEPKADAA